MTEQRLWIGVVAAAFLIAVPTHAQTPAVPSSGTAVNQKDSKGDPNLDILTKLEPADREILKKIYMPQIQKRIFQFWRTFIPVEAQPPQSRSGNVDIDFYISSEGRLTQMHLGPSSGWEGLNRSAWGAITTSHPFPPFPPGVSARELGMRLHFTVNQNRPETVHK